MLTVSRSRCLQTLRSSSKDVVRAKVVRTHARQASRSSSLARSFASSHNSVNSKLPLYLAALAAVPAVVLASNDDKPQITTEEPVIIEPRTGLTVPVINNGQSLIGTAARSVTFLGFLTYAFAVYRDPKKWEAQLNEYVLHDLVASPSGTTLRIVTYRDIDCTHFCSSINSGAVPRMKKTLEANNMPSNDAHDKAEQIGKDFRAVFTTKDLPSKTAIDFRIEKSTSPNSELNVSVFVNGERQGQVSGDLFANALVALYFGADPRSTEIQNGVQACLNRRTNKA